MTVMERAASILQLARSRHPLAVTPGHVLSPMDAQRTVSISRELIVACDQQNRAAIAEPA